MTSERMAETRGRDREPTTSFAEGAGIIWRLAIDVGLTPDQANDVCFLMLQQAILDSRPDDPVDSRRSGWLVRTAVEQCAVVRRLAWQRRQLTAARQQRLHLVSS